MAQNDIVLNSLKRLYERNKSLGKTVIMCSNGQKISSEQMIKELENDTEIGQNFRNEVFDTIISYFMKFETL